ncbi:MAG: DUF4339 domain-containing protein [Planctomycetes bacterium]|nr:DUF4339 domain-containing protein [Planctomycetota bacterium]
MDETLYIRIRGRVQGPFDQEKLQQLARRGQLSRIHEVSPDGAAWRKAGDYPELFVSSAPSSGVSGVNHGRQSSPALAPAGSPAAAEPQWYYARNGSQHGPTRFAELQQLAATAQLAPTDAVWCEGMSEWTAAQGVRGLFPASPAPAEATRQRGARGDEDDRAPSSKLSAGLGRTIGDSQTWVMFIVVFGYIFAGLMITGGVLLMIGIADDNVNAGFIGTVLMWFLYAGVLITGSVLLNRYHGAVVRFLQSRSEARLDAALRRLRSFWIFIGIVLIVITVNMVVGMVFLFSMAASFADMFS